MGLNDWLDPVLSWTLDLPLWLSILILAFVITLIINIIYKYTTDQEELKRLKKKLKSLQKDMKENRSDTKKTMKIQQESMQVNMKYMKSSLKSTLYTFIPIIIIFSWMNANLAFAMIEPTHNVGVQAILSEPARITLEAADLRIKEPTQDTVEKQAKWVVSGPAGTHTMTFTTSAGEKATHDILIGEVPETNLKRDHDEPFKQTTVMYPKATPFGSFSLFGYNPGWLFTYIIFSIALSLGMRKIMGLA